MVVISMSDLLPSISKVLVGAQPRLAVSQRPEQRFACWVLVRKTDPSLCWG
jgi:hypothetical protein